MIGETGTADVLEIAGGAKVRMTLEIMSEPDTDAVVPESVNECSGSGEPEDGKRPAFDRGLETTQFEADQVTVGTDSSSDRFTLSILNRTRTDDEWILVGLTRHQVKRLRQSLGNMLRCRKEQTF